MATAYLGLGSNKGGRINFIQNAVIEIEKIFSTSVVKASSVYETEPWGFSDQDDYLNCAVEINTKLIAEVLLKELKNIEIKLGRQDNKKWSEREIDIDLLFFEYQIIRSVNMNVPHPQLEHRKFVLIPLNEIAPDLNHPVLNKNISELLKECRDELYVRKYEMNEKEIYVSGRQ